MNWNWNWILTVLTSAGVSAIVTQLMSIWAQRLERKAKQEDMLFQYALDLAKTRNERFLQVVKDFNISKWQMQDDIVTAEKYYEWLRYLRKHGKLPDDPMIQRINEDED
jgi:hypothetical protein